MRNCRACAGSGWVIVERNGFSGAERCRCSQVRKMGGSGKPKLEEILELVFYASDVIPFFPKEQDPCKLLAAEIQSFVGDRHSFEVFRQKLLRATAYEGLGGLRTLYCSLFEPADGEYPSGSEDAEGRAMMREIEENTRRFEYYRQQAKSLPPADTLYLLPAPAVVASATPEPAMKLVARRSLKEREDALAAAIAHAPTRSEEERRKLVEEIEKRLQVA